MEVRAQVLLMADGEIMDHGPPALGRVGEAFNTGKEHATILVLCTAVTTVKAKKKSTNFAMWRFVFEIVVLYF